MLKIADSDDGTEDSVPDLIDDEISTFQDKVQILGIELYHDETYINRPISYHPMIMDIAHVYTGYQRVQKQVQATSLLWSQSTRFRDSKGRCHLDDKCG